jgi:AAHS family 3-hydroxyphenylpropionic acid transporter
MSKFQHFTKRSILIVTFCCVAGLGEGYDTQTPGVTLPLIGQLFHLTGGSVGLLQGLVAPRSLYLSMSTVGLFFGALLGGRLADLAGRKWVAVISVVMFAVLSGLTALALSRDALLWLRFGTGLGLGGALPALMTICAEAAPRSRRTTVIGLLYASLPVGGALASLVSFYTSNGAGWQRIYVVGALLPLLAIPGLIVCVEGVPRTSEIISGHKPSVSSALFGDGRTFTTVGVWLCFLCALIVSYLLLSWLPTLLIARGLSKPEASLVQLCYNLAGGVGSIVAGISTDIHRYSRTIVGTFFSAISALALLAFVPVSFFGTVALASLVGATVLGSQGIIYSLGPAIYPQQMRGTGVGFAVAAGRLGAMSGPLLAGAMLGAGLSASQILAVLIPIMLIEGTAAWYVSDAGIPPAPPALKSAVC